MNQISVFYFFNIKTKIIVLKLDQEELQKQSEILKEQKIKQIKDDIKTSCLILFEFPEEIENIIISYSFDESKIETNNSLHFKVRKYYKTNKEHLINELDVSCVTSMTYLFYKFNEFNQQLDKWDTSNVVDMSYMFHNCQKFNQPVNFNTRNVINMAVMFYNCFEFNCPVNFDTQNVTNMLWMFASCYKFNQPVNFDVRNVADMDYMFNSCFALEKKNKLLIMH